MSSYREDGQLVRFIEIDTTLINSKLYVCVYVEMYSFQISSLDLLTVDCLGYHKNDSSSRLESTI
jgi:hypothetical protein